jgi:hypothetical protein
VRSAALFKEMPRLKTVTALTRASPERDEGVKIFLRSGVHEIVREKKFFRK